MTGLGPTITVLYSCSGCGVYRQRVEVRARQTEAVIDWMLQVMAAGIGADHSQRSPRCQSRTMSEALIPVTGTDCVGGAAMN